MSWLRDLVRGQARYERALSDEVHVAGVVREHEQRCGRCGCVLAVGRWCYSVGQLVRRMEFGDGSATVAERECLTGELCKRAA